MNLARALWPLYEPIHAVTYFAPQARAAADAAGFRGFWMSYYAMRIAPLGAVGPDVATAAFYGFSPSRAHRALPAAWQHASPEEALSARLAGADQALQVAWAGLAAHARVEEAADLAEVAARAADTAGRLLAAANAALPYPQEPRLRLWQAATVLREHRGDGHNAALVAAGIGPIQAHILKEVAGETPKGVLRSGRDWSDDQWSAAEVDLCGRGWVDDGGRLTEAGAAAKSDVEHRTDQASTAPWRALGDARTERLATLLLPLARAVIDAGAYRAPSPIGAPAPAWTGPSIPQSGQEA